MAFLILGKTGNISRWRPPKYFLGEIEKDYIKNSHAAFCSPLHTFLDGEMKNIMRERKILENRRLDLDSCKGNMICLSARSPCEIPVPKCSSDLGDALCFTILKNP